MGEARVVVEVESLLGWCVAEEVDRTLRCDIIFPDGLTTIFEPSPVVLDPGFSDFGDPEVPSKCVFVGVGGVTVVTGWSIMRAGGVKGRRDFSRLGIELV